MAYASTVMGLKLSALSKPSVCYLAISVSASPWPSMTGLAMLVSNDATTASHSTFSWNDVASVLYLDQPIGTRPLHGDLKIGTSLDRH
ncbi:hypothetical protein D9619_004612 [Psilocybe cf. subviscida]|uniref:Uncharacterized protein n=1 Tax=Psilocybe cf. subviscida TaxID=2480587 RepID=A0A8H5BPB3_9AGAR|nr:hypothetical protein D9619_004612 [Psilocybe cf. subviscida]